MQLPTLLLLAAALGASAHPSVHGQLHNHRAAHAALAQRGHPVFWKPSRPKTTTTSVVAPVTTSSTTATPPPVATSTTTTAAVVAPATTTTTSKTPATPTSVASASSAASAAVAAPFCGGKTSKRATVAQIAYSGNTGIAGDWGCNMMLVDAAVASQYKYTAAYTNRGSVSHQVTCFNKIGPAGLINGFFGFSAVSFELAPGASRTVAFDSNTQGSCSHHPDSIPKTTWGEWAGTWVEFDFENASNNNWSGADCSSLVAQSAGLDVPSCRVSASGQTSTINAGGSGTNAYTKGTENDDGIGLNLSPGNVRLVVDVGF